MPVNTKAQPPCTTRPSIARKMKMRRTAPPQNEAINKNKNAAMPPQNKSKYITERR